MLAPALLRFLPFLLLWLAAVACTMALSVIPVAALVVVRGFSASLWGSLWRRPLNLKLQLVLTLRCGELFVEWIVE